VESGCPIDQIVRSRGAPHDRLTAVQCHTPPRCHGFAVARKITTPLAPPAVPAPILGSLRSTFGRLRGQVDKPRRLIFESEREMPLC